MAKIKSSGYAKDIADQYDIDPRKTASILDTFSACWQGIIPYGAQLITFAATFGSQGTVLRCPGVSSA